MDLQFGALVSTWALRLGSHDMQRYINQVIFLWLLLNLDQRYDTVGM